MKKKILSFAAIILTLFAGNITCFATDITATPAKSWSNFFDYLAESPITIAVLIVLAVIIIAVIVLHKPLAKKLNNSTSAQMLNTFITLFAVFGIGSFILAFLSDGITFQHMLHSESTDTGTTLHFFDYLNTIRDAGSQNFYKSADNFSPMAMFIFYVIAQFMPAQYIFSTSLAHLLQMTRNQTFIYCYLIILMMLIVLLYKTSRNMLRENGVKFREELFTFLLIVSYPTLYCIKLGNIVGLSYAFAMFFIAFRNSEKRSAREMALVSLAVSAAITPYTLIFVLLLFSKDKNSFYNISKTVLYSVILFILPAFFTGFDSLGAYISNLFKIPVTIDAANISISNILMFIGIENKVLLHIISAVFIIAATACIFILPSVWQKAAAALYVIINLVPSSPNAILLFVFIPLILMLSQKAHKAVDWLYLASFSLLIMPLPEWFWFENESFNSMFESIGVYSVLNANEVFAPFAVQLLFVLIVSQSISVLIKCKKNKSIPTE